MNDGSINDVDDLIRLLAVQIFETTDGYEFTEDYEQSREWSAALAEALTRTRSAPECWTIYFDPLDFRGRYVPSHKCGQQTKSPAPTARRARAGRSSSCERGERF